MPRAKPKKRTKKEMGEAYTNMMLEKIDHDIQIFGVRSDLKEKVGRDEFTALEKRVAYIEKTALKR